MREITLPKIPLIIISCVRYSHLFDNSIIIACDNIIIIACDNNFDLTCKKNYNSKF